MDNNKRGGGHRAGTQPEIVQCVQDQRLTRGKRRRKTISSAAVVVAAASGWMAVPNVRRNADEMRWEEGNNQDRCVPCPCLFSRTSAKDRVSCVVVVPRRGESLWSGVIGSHTCFRAFRSTSSTTPTDERNGAALGGTARILYTYNYSTKYDNDCPHGFEASSRRIISGANERIGGDVDGERHA